MSDTHIHKAKGKFNQGIGQDNIPRNLQNHYDRYNSEKAYFKKLQLNLKETIADRDMNIELDRFSICECGYMHLSPEIYCKNCKKWLV